MVFRPQKYAAANRLNLNCITSPGISECPCFCESEREDEMKTAEPVLGSENVFVCVCMPAAAV